MVDRDLLFKVRVEVGRVNTELHELHLEEERCRIRRGRLEKEKLRIQTLLEHLELMQQLVDKPGPDFDVTYTPVMPEHPNGPKFVNVIPRKVAPLIPADQPIVPTRRKLKPDGLPSVTTMIISALEASAVISADFAGMCPRELADFVRTQWWPEVKTNVISTTAWKMARNGELAKDGSRYKLNGHGK